MEQDVYEPVDQDSGAPPPVLPPARTAPRGALPPPPPSTPSPPPPPSVKRHEKKGKIEECFTLYMYCYSCEACVLLLWRNIIVIISDNVCILYNNFNIELC